MTRWFSLRRRLLLMLLGGAAIGWLVTLGWGYVDAHHEIDELFDAQLAQAAQALLARRHDLEDDDLEQPEHVAHPYQSALKFQIWHADGKLAARSPNAPETPLALVDGFSETNGPGGHWRFYSQWDQRHRHRVQVAENHAVRDELIGHIELHMLLPALFGLPLIGAWVWFATRRSLKPLDAVARQVEASGPERLHAVAPATAPEEIRPLIDALNDLFRRVDQALANERRFTADAAHELRTPLAALAAQAQVAIRARDDAERQHALELLTTGMARASRLVDQLLTLARLEPDSVAPATTAVHLDEIAQEACADHGPRAIAKDIALELDATPVTIEADGELLRILLRNLIDNALRYTPSGGAVHVAVTSTPATASIRVSDTGPGIPPAERERVFERFARLAGQDIEGSGLGLSIVRRIAERHGATIELNAGDGGKGLAVTIRFKSRPGAAG